MVSEGGRGVLMRGKLLSDGKLVKHLFRYIARTGRFSETWGDLDEVLSGNGWDGDNGEIHFDCLL
jgi:hypothetical protein